jgi:hemoglobin
MKKDIKNRIDIELLVNTFYEKVKADKTIGYFFTDVAKVNWNKHLPVMYDFWENILFFTGKYEGNPMLLHHNLSKTTSVQKKHFTRWNKLFNNTVDELFWGEKAELIKKRAANISSLIQINIFSKKDIL